MKIFRGGMMLAFFLIVPSVMAVSILSIHVLAKRLGLRIYYATLVAAAITTFMVTFAAAETAAAIGRGYLTCLGIFIAAAAAVLTAANKFLLNKHREEEKKFDAEVKAAFEAEKKSSSAKKNPGKFSWSEDETSLDEKNFLPEEKAVPAYNEILDDEKIPDAEKISDDEKISDVEKISDGEKVSDDEKISDDVEKISDVEEKISDAEKVPDVEEKISDDAETAAELSEEPTLPEGFPLEKIFQALTEIKPKDVDKPIKLPESRPPDEFPFDKVFQPLSEIKREETPPPPEKKSAPAEIFPLQEVFRPLSNLDLEKLEEITEEEKNLPREPETKPEEKIDTLDDLLDKAYDERDKGHVWQAIETYKKALERYQNDEYAPFVAIDLCNIYKEQALYSEAVKIYEKALTLPTVERNASVKKEFVNTLKYLRVVREILQKHHALSTPFSRLSKEILQEVDIEFKKVQINSRE